MINVVVFCASSADEGVMVLLVKFLPGGKHACSAAIGLPCFYEQTLECKIMHKILVLAVPFSSGRNEA